MRFFAAADIFSLLLFLGVVIASAIANWLKRRRGESDEPITTAPAPGRSVRRESGAPSRAASWEEEIRRMLEGATAEPPPTPPPIVISSPARPAPARPGPEAVAPQPAPVPGPIARAGKTAKTGGHERRRIEHLGELRESASARAHASQLHEAVTHRLETVDLEVTNARPEGVVNPRRRRSAEAEAVLGLLRRSRDARQLIIAQAILGPPKALEG